MHHRVQGSCIQLRFVSSAHPHVISHQLTLQHAISKEAFDILSNTTDAQGRKLQASPRAEAVACVLPVLRPYSVLSDVPGNSGSFLECPLFSAACRTLCR